MQIGSLLEVVKKEPVSKRIYKVATAPLVIGSGLLGAGVGAVGGAIGGAVLGAGAGGITGGALGAGGAIKGLNYLYGDVDSRPYSKLEKQNQAKGFMHKMSGNKKNGIEKWIDGSGYHKRMYSKGKVTMSKDFP